VCSVSDSGRTDGRIGYYIGKLSLGANKIDGIIDESQIAEHKVCFANSSGYKQGRAWGTVTLHGKELVSNYLSTNTSTNTSASASASVGASTIIHLGAA
jgi:hypothetical protein